MANPSSTPPADIDFTAPINNLLESPDKRVGDDQGAISIRQNPLYRPGTPARIEFDAKKQMTIEVRFKIYTPTAVNFNIPSQSPDKVGAGKKPPKSMKLNLINSKKIKGKYLEFKSCLIGKSLNEFKTLVADACEGYSAGMKTIVLNRNFLPELKWKTTVGRSKQDLNSVVQWQAFVGALEKSIKKQGLVVIENENVDVQSVEENRESATIQLIEQTNGGGPNSQVAEERSKDADLHILANEIFSQAGISGYAGGEGTVLSVPWNPAFRYRLTYTAAWIWAKGVQANIATQHLPPNTREFNRKIKRSEWQHPNMGVDDRLKAVQGTSTSKGGKVRQSSLFSESKPDLKYLDRKPFIDLTNQINSKPDVKPFKNKRVIDLTEPINTKPDLKKAANWTELIDIKPDVKNFTFKNQPGQSINDPITLLSDIASDCGDCNTEDSEAQDFSNETTRGHPIELDDTDENASESDIEIPTSQHSVQMEFFLADCKVPYEDEQTRRLLKEAGIISWTDLIPSVQMTESTLTTKGIDRQIASRLMAEAKARYLTYD
ncbi:hypothetical protein DFH28DRAFT_1084588 [Melampsora americana]|nr:hypothetical protein DFH28DRAFT_1084588 [Melampsora americana]